MNHDQALDALDEWLDGELPPEAVAAMKAHHDACADCRRRAESRRRLAAAAFPPPPLTRASDEAFVRALLAKLEAEEAGPAWAEALTRWLSPALGLALAVSAAVILAPSVEWPHNTLEPEADWVLEAP